MLTSRDLAHLQSDFVTAEFFHQIEAEIDRSVDAAAAEDPAVFRHELFGPPENLGIALAQYLGHRPVGGRLPAVEQSAFRKERNTRADACNVGAARMPLAQPGQKGGVSCNPVLHVQAGSRKNDDIGPLDVMDRALRRQAQGAEAHHAGSVNRGDPHPETRLRRVAMEQDSRARPPNERLRSARSPSTRNRLPKARLLRPARDHCVSRPGRSDCLGRVDVPIWHF